jgi:hypothetical protein
MRINGWLRPAVILCCALLGFVSQGSSQEMTICAGPEQPNVVITTQKDAYCREDPIAITIRNESSSAIFVTSGQTFCTILSLEKRENDSWRMAGRCLAGAPPGIISIPAREELVISLGPNSHFYVPIAPGRYRVALAFAHSADGLDRRVAYSREFDILDC